MKFADHVSKTHIQQFNQLRRFAVDHSEKPKQQEKLSRRDWEDIMGKNRDTYKRKNGAIRRK